MAHNAGKQVQIGGMDNAFADMGDGDYAQVGVSGARFAQTAAVVAGGTISAVIDCGEAGVLCGLIMGGSVNAAGTMYLYASNTNPPAAVRLVGDDNAVMSYAWAAANTPIVMKIANTFPWRYFKVDCGAAQTNGATITAVTRGM